MMEDPAEAVTADRVAVAEAFKRYDVDNSGSISADELGALCEELGAGLDPVELQSALRRLDADGSGAIEAAEFEAWWSGRVDEVLGEKLSALAAAGRRSNEIDIYTACWQGRSDLVEEFVAMDPDAARAPDLSEFGGGYTALHYAAYAGHLEIVEALVQRHRASVESKNDAGCTPLFLASQQGHAAVVRFLLKRGARVSETDAEHGFSPLEVAASSEIRELLLGECDQSPPATVQEPPRVRCSKFGTLEVSWTLPRGSSGKALPLQQHLIELRQADDDFEEGKTQQSERDEDEEEVRFSRQVELSGSNPGRTVITGLQDLPFFLEARVASRNASGLSEFSAWSESVLCASVPTVTQAPEAQPLGKRSVEVKWPKAVSNGCKLTAYRLEGAVLASSMVRRTSTMSSSSSASLASASSSRASASALDLDAVEWDVVAVVPAKTTRKVIEQMRPGAYVFRVVAANMLGKSKPGPPSLAVRVG